MKFNVTLDNEQINEIANVTADKVLSTVRYCRNNEKWYESEFRELKNEIQKRDSMLVQKDFIIDRLREALIKTRLEVKELKNNIKELEMYEKL